ncbi:MAG: PIN domain-containing protein [Candidatus Odinarchaeota archaeon]|nr:PIN domain-containing protein [Candidatus Odinarchaeota archaeon]
MGILIDTGIFFAFYSKRDVHHFDSLVLIIHALEGKWGRPYITDHILDETLNLLKYKLSHETALEFLNAFIKSNNLEIIIADEDIIRQSLELFQKNWNVKGFSFTDAISITTAKRYQLEYVMTYNTFLSKFLKVINSSYVQSLPKEEIVKIKHITGNVM